MTDTFTTFQLRIDNAIAWVTFDFPPVDRERGYDLIEVLDELAKEKDTTIPKLALSWLLHQGDDIYAIPGSRKPARIDENTAATDVVLSNQVLQTIDQSTVHQVSDIAIPTFQ